MKFTLEIELGNDAMQDSRDLRRALHDVNLQPMNSGIQPGQAGTISDLNGNMVGRWEVTDETACAVCGKPAAKHGHWSATDPQTHQWKARA